MGVPRLTIDIDFIGDNIHPAPLHKTLMQVAKELKIHVEPVPLDRFIHLPKGSEGRVIRIGQYRNLEVFVADPYSIALSKLNRGLDIDFDDIVFLVQKNYVNMDEFEHMVKDALPHARKYDFDPNIVEHLQELRNRLHKFRS